MPSTDFQTMGIKSKIIMLYIQLQKKTGFAKDDYPSQALLSNVKKINYEKFSLSCFSSAFIAS